MRREELSESLVLPVSDTHIGIDPLEVPTATEPYRRTIHVMSCSIEVVEEAAAPAS